MLNRNLIDATSFRLLLAASRFPCPLSLFVVRVSVHSITIAGWHQQG